MQDLVNEGKIKARSKWKEVYPLFKEDDRYLNMLGNPGSNPLELFWDAVDALDQKLDAKVAVVEDVLRQWSPPGVEVGKPKVEADGDVKMGEAEKGFVVQVDTKEEEFMKVVKDGATEAVGQLSEEDLHEVFSAVSTLLLPYLFNVRMDVFTSFQLKDTALKRRAEEKRRAERKQRHLQDDLRYAMKKLPEPIDITLSYEEVSLHSHQCLGLS